MESLRRTSYFLQVNKILFFKIINKFINYNNINYINYRLMSPEPVKKVGLLPHLGSRFRYSGRTHYETKKIPIERQPPQFERSLSGRRLTSRSMDGILVNCSFFFFYFLNFYFY